jgi:hypothetical protein
MSLLVLAVAVAVAGCGGGDGSGTGMAGTAPATTAVSAPVTQPTAPTTVPAITPASRYTEAALRSVLLTAADVESLLTVAVTADPPSPGGDDEHSGCAPPDELVASDDDTALEVEQSFSSADDALVVNETITYLPGRARERLDALRTAIASCDILILGGGRLAVEVLDPFLVAGDYAVVTRLTGQAEGTALTIDVVAARVDDVGFTLTVGGATPASKLGSAAEDLADKAADKLLNDLEPRG